MMVRQNRLIVLPWVQSFCVELHPDVHLILFVLAILLGISLAASLNKDQRRIRVRCNLAWDIDGYWRREFLQTLT